MRRSLALRNQLLTVSREEAQPQHCCLQRGTLRGHSPVPTHLHDLQQRLGDRLQRGQGEGLALVGAGREGPVAVAGAERDHRGRLHFADPKQQIKFGQRELSQAQP